MTTATTTLSDGSTVAAGDVARTMDTVRAPYAARTVLVLRIAHGEAWCLVRIGRRDRHAAFAPGELRAIAHPFQSWRV